MGCRFRQGNELSSLRNSICLTALSLPLFLWADLKVDVYGYAKLDIQYNTKNTGSLPSPPPNFVPLDSDKSAQHGETLIDARESRIGVRAVDQFDKVEMSGAVEGDFYTIDGDALVNNSRHFRLRLAYGKGELPSGFFILAGQYWSLFMNDTIAQPNLIDFNGPVGSPYARQPQLRIGYHKHINDCLPQWGDILLQASVEKQAIETTQGVFDPNSLVNPAQGSGQNLPLAVAKISWLLKNFQIEFAGTGAQSVLVTNLAGQEAKKLVWGAQTSAQYTYKKLTLFGSAHYLSGLSRLDGGNFDFDVVIKGNKLIPVRSTGWYAGGSWAFTKALSFNTVFGWDRAKEIPNSPFSGTVYGKYLSFHANFIQTFWKRWQTGLEFERFYCTAFDGQKGSVNMFHTAIYYFF
jgi:hypothetical protein